MYIFIYAPRIGHREGRGVCCAGGLKLQSFLGMFEIVGSAYFLAFPTIFVLVQAPHGTSWQGGYITILTMVAWVSLFWCTCNLLKSYPCTMKAIFYTVFWLLHNVSIFFKRFGTVGWCWLCQVLAPYLQHPVLQTALLVWVPQDLFHPELIRRDTESSSRWRSRMIEICWIGATSCQICWLQSCLQCFTREHIERGDI